MKKLTKIGLSALCGSLAAISAASAGAITVTGAAKATFTSLGGSNATTGNPLGMATNLTFAGSGELDGGQAISVTIAHTDQNAYSSSNITLTTNSLGSFKLSQAEGGQGIGGYDDNMPRAVEEVWDAGAASNINLQKGVGSSTNVSWTSPSFLGTTLQLAYAPENDGTQTNDKATGGASGSSIAQEGLDVVLNIDPDIAFGPNLFIGYSQTSQPTVANVGAHTKEARKDKHEEGVVGLKFSIGPLEVGGQGSAEYTGLEAAGDVTMYGTTSWGVAFNVNDDLSVSYGEARSIKVTQNEMSNPKRKMQGDSFQVAYTMGGVALKYADTSWNNAKYTEGNSATAKIIVMSMAF